ncbi:MAG TPA: hypothetical protein VI316_04305 [Candidatus Dormibacteraeota bacterium]
MKVIRHEERGLGRELICDLGGDAADRLRKGSATGIGAGECFPWDEVADEQKRNASVHLMHLGPRDPDTGGISQRDGSPQCPGFAETGLAHDEDTAPAP